MHSASELLLQYKEFITLLKLILLKPIFIATTSCSENTIGNQTKPHQYLAFVGAHYLITI